MIKTVIKNKQSPKKKEGPTNQQIKKRKKCAVYTDSKNKVFEKDGCHKKFAFCHLCKYDPEKSYDNHRKHIERKKEVIEKEHIVRSPNGQWRYY